MADNLDTQQLVGQTINGFLLLKELGRGNNGIVYLARQEMLDREVAFKVLLPEWGTSPEYLVNFFREAKLVAKLDHPNIVQALETGNSPEGVHYFVMELIKGRSLEEIRQTTPELLSLEFILKMAIQLADALSYAWHSRQLIHGDIKPGNLLIRDSDQQLKLVDLGVARIGAMELGDGEIMATPMYAAPELINGRGNLTFKADIYSFGIMLYELIAGRAPFGGKMEQLLEAHLSQVPEPLIEVNPDTDRPLAEFIDQMLAKDPDARPESWEQVRDFFTAVFQRLFPRRPAALVANSAGAAAPSELQQMFAEQQQRGQPEAHWEKNFRIISLILVVLAVISVILLLVFLGF